MRRKKKEQEAAAPGDRRVTPVDIQQVEFRLAFRGYSERDVDAFLDRLTEDLSSYLEEMARLRASAASPGAMPVAGAVGAEEIVAQAREEAATIIRRAQEQAVAIRATAGAEGTGDTRAAVAPFLNMERDFLQSLGSLVQGHAEEIKQMVLALRARVSTEPSSTPSVPPMPEQASASPPTAAPQTTPVGDERAGFDVASASAPEIAERLGMPAMSADRAEDEPEEDEQPVVVESSTEPAYSTEGAPAGERRERSLRELFWGED